MKIETGSELYGVIRGCIEKVNEITVDYRRQAIWYASDKLSDLTSDLQAVLDLMQAAGLTAWVDKLLETLTGVLQAQKEDDVLLLADVLEYQLSPILTGVQDSLRSEGSVQEKSYWDENMALLKETDKELWHALRQEADSDTVYHLEEAVTGAKTIRLQEYGKDFYFHSCIDPQREAVLLADSYYDSRIEEYIFYGFGLGYYAKEMLNKSRICRITVIEPDLEFLKIAFSYMDLKELFAENRVRIQIGNEKDYISLLAQKGRRAVGIILYQMLKRIRDPQILESMKEYYMKSSSVKWQNQMLEENFLLNQRTNVPEIGELTELFHSRRKMLLIAAGPSLSEDMELLKEVSRKKEFVIAAVGTVAEKVINYGIEIDAIIVTTGVKEMASQIRDINAPEVPLCMLSTAANSIAEEYKGPVYLIYQKDFALAEETARERGYTLYSSGGTVASLALDVGIQMDCREICFAGLDLAYTGNKTHVEGTGDIVEAIEDASGMRQVEKVGGGTVSTPVNLDSNRKWIEKRIQRSPQVRYINTSKGARIAGTLEKSLKSYCEEIGIL